MINFVPFSVWQRTRMVRIGFLKRLFKNRFRLLFGIAPTSGVADIKSNFQMPKRLFPPKVQRWMEQCFINRRNNPRPIQDQSKEKIFSFHFRPGPVIIMMMTLMLELPMHLHAFSWNKWNGEAILKKKTGSGLSQNVRNRDDKDLLQTFYVKREY